MFSCEFCEISKNTFATEHLCGYSVIFVFFILNQFKDLTAWSICNIKCFPRMHMKKAFRKMSEIFKKIWVFEVHNF